MFVVFTLRLTYAFEEMRRKVFTSKRVVVFLANRKCGFPQIRNDCRLEEGVLAPDPAGVCQRLASFLISLSGLLVTCQPELGKCNAAVRLARRCFDGVRECLWRVIGFRYRTSTSFKTSHPDAEEEGG